MGLDRHMLAGFTDELEKIAVSHRRMTVSRSRKGRRPMSVATLLKKEKEGTLYKPSAFLDGNKTASLNAPEVPFIAQEVAGQARPPKKKGDVPSRDDDGAAPKREYGQESVSIVPGTGQNYSMIDAASIPSERNY